MTIFNNYPEKINPKATDYVLIQDNDTATLLSKKVKIGALTTMLEQVQISNNTTDANNDIDFGVGSFEFNDKSGFALNGSILVKQLDAVWEIGTNKGGLDTGTKAINTWYHCFCIYNPTTKISDALFSVLVNPTANLPAGYTKYKRVGSIKTDGSGNILAFEQKGADFVWISHKADLVIANPTTTYSNLIISTPLGLQTKASMFVSMLDTNANNTIVSTRVNSISKIDEAGLTANTALMVGAVGAQTAGSGSKEILTDILSQIRYKINYTSATLTLAIVCEGWKDLFLN